MGTIVNEATNTFPLFVAVREQLEHRALWLYLLVDEAEKRGLSADEFAPAAIRRCGLYQGMGIVEKSGTKSLKGLKKVLFTRAAQEVFEMEVKECSDDVLSIDFHYCPLVKAWQKQGCTDEQIAHLCDIAMCGDRGIAQAHGCVLDLPKTIAKGDGICEIRFTRAPKQTRRERARQAREEAKIRKKEAKHVAKLHKKAEKKEAAKEKRLERKLARQRDSQLKKRVFRLPIGRSTQNEEHAEEAQ